MKSKRIAALGAVAALALAGCGSQAATSSTGATQPAQGQRPQMDVSALAKALGVTTTKLQAAMQKSRPQAGQQPTGSPGDMAATLAQELGLSESKVQAALAKYMPQGGPPNGQAPPSASGTTTSS